jgi:predicted DNA-binding protein with PD1-like motif
MEPGESFFPTLSQFCRDNDVRCGYVPMFLAAFAEAEIVGACEKLADPNAPVWSKVHLENVEAFGGGTIAYDPETDDIKPHIHVALGEKSRSAHGYASHLLSAQVQFLVEMILTETISPAITRPANPDLYNVPVLTFGA